MNDDSAENRRILIIDDNLSIQDDYKKLLSGETDADDNLNRMNAELFGVVGHSPYAPTYPLDFALQGKAGFEMAQAALQAGRPYAMAFVDIKMPPGWDGVETVARIWQVAPDLQIVLCTAYSDYTWDEIASRLGRSDHFVILKKPFENMEVQQLAHACTRKWNRIQRAKRTGLRFGAMGTADLRAASLELRKEMERRISARTMET